MREFLFIFEELYQLLLIGISLFVDCVVLGNISKRKLVFSTGKFGGDYESQLEIVLDPIV